MKEFIPHAVTEILATTFMSSADHAAEENNRHPAISSKNCRCQNLLKNEQMPGSFLLASFTYHFYVYC